MERAARPFSARSMRPVRALHFTLGWQMGRIGLELPYLVSVGVFSVGVVWLAVLVSRGAGADLTTSLAVAQVVAASISILITTVRYY